MRVSTQASSTAPEQGATVNAKSHKTVVKDLQATLVELIDLSLLGKQAHWNHPPAA
jgi:DNA-binding ferritin-like protein